MLCRFQKFQQSLSEGRVPIAKHGFTNRFYGKKRHVLLMDGFSRYNQIRMAPKDAEKTAFRTPMGNFYYTMMPFGLKKRGCNLSMSDDSHISRYDALGIRGLCGQHSG